MEVSSKKLEETLYLVIMYPCAVESKAQGFFATMHPKKLLVAGSVGYHASREAASGRLGW